MQSEQNDLLVKVPAVTLGFWIIKILATTLGETGGDAVSMSMDLGYLIATIIFMAIFVAAVVAQIKAKRFHPVLYWATIVASTTVGTTMADFATRSLGIGYSGGSSLLLLLLVALHYATNTSKTALFWIAFVLTRPLGAVVGDFLDKPFANGGLALSRYGASAILLLSIVLLIWLLPQRAAERTH